MKYIKPENRLGQNAIIDKPHPKKPTKLTTKKSIVEFTEIGIESLHNRTEKELSKMLLFANDKYYNTEESCITDGQFDILKEYITEKYPNNKSLGEIGAPIKKNKVQLPYFMASMNKIKPDTNALKNWQSKYKGPFVVSTKLDGVSALYSTEGDEPKLYTRGNGKIGQDISYAIEYLQLPTEKNLTIRGELIISKKNFKKWEKVAKNARSFI